MSATVKVDDVKMRDALNSLVDLGLDTGRVLKVEARRLLKEVIKRTPPDDRAQGENAIKEDIFGGRRVNLGRGNVIKTIGIFWIIGDASKPQFRNDGVAQFFTNQGEVIGTEQRFYRPNASVEEMQRVHEAARSSATGRVSIAGSMTHSVGRWRFVDRMSVKKSTANRYFRFIKQHVGKMKGGWAVAAKSLGVNVSAWIDRHAGSQNGYVNQSLGKTDSPFITIGNTSRGVEKKMASAVKRALHNRAESIKLNVARMIKHGRGASGDYGYASE